MEKEKALKNNISMQLGMVENGVKTHDQAVATILGFAVKYAQEYADQSRKADVSGEVPRCNCIEACGPDCNANGI